MYRKLTPEEIEELLGPEYLARLRAAHGEDFTPDLWVPIDG